jgi:transposase
MKNTIKGGKADKMSVEDIAKKFKVSVDTVKAQIKKGIEIEKEHTNDKEKATEIAMDHVTEFPDYYDRIEKMEKDAKKKWDVSESSKSFIKRLLREGVKF